MQLRCLSAMILRKYYNIKNMPNFFTPFTSNIETNIFLTAAERFGWQVKVIAKENGYALGEISKGQHRYRIINGRISVNSSTSTTISSDKYLTNVVLQPFTPYLTHPQKLLIDELTDAQIEDFLARYPKVVVKPVDRNNGLGVTTSLTDLASIKAAIAKLKPLGSKTVLIEEHIDITREYRVMVWKGKIIDVLQRIPAYVIGDGESTIGQLIVEKNATRFKHFNTIFEPINIDDDLDNLLSKQNYTVESILTAGTYLSVETTCNLSQGGEVKRIELETIHPEYQTLFDQAYQATWLNYCGADIITPDITKPPVEGQTVINELNGAPGITLAFYDDLATNRPFLGCQRILEQMENDPVALALGLRFF